MSELTAEAIRALMSRPAERLLRSAPDIAAQALRWHDEAREWQRKFWEADENRKISDEFMTVSDERWRAAEAELTAARARIAALEEALRPFEMTLRRVSGLIMDGVELHIPRVDLEKARAALHEAGDAPPPLTDASATRDV